MKIHLRWGSRWTWCGERIAPRPPETYVLTQDRQEVTCSWCQRAIQEDAKP
jgi:hypothetical protein